MTLESPGGVPSQRLYQITDASEKSPVLDKLVVVWFMVESLLSGKRELWRDQHLNYRTFVECGVEKRNFGFRETSEKICHVFSEEECEILTSLCEERIFKDDYYIVRDALHQKDRDFTNFKLRELCAELKVSVS